MKNANALAIDLIANEKANIWQNTKNNDSNTQRLCFHTALFHAVLISSLLFFLPVYLWKEGCVRSVNGPDISWGFAAEHVRHTHLHTYKHIYTQCLTSVHSHSHFNDIHKENWWRAIELFYCFYNNSAWSQLFRLYLYLQLKTLCFICFTSRHLSDIGP